MKTLALITLSAFAATTAFAEVKVSVSEISDKRTTGKFFKGLELQLKFAGPEVVDAKGMRVVIEKATDDTGKDLEKPENSFYDEKDFQEIQRSNFGLSDEERDAKDITTFKLEFANPPRSAKSIKSLTGSVEFLLPKGDPASIVTASVAKDSGKPLDNAALKAAGVEFTLKGIKGNDISYTINDPKGAVASVEFVGKDGAALETNGRMSSGGFGGGKSVSISFSDTPPADATAQIYLVTAKSLVKVPVKLVDVALP